MIKRIINVLKGRTIEIAHFSKISSESDLKLYKEKLIESKQVKIGCFEKILSRSLIVFLRQGGKLKAACAIKIPNESYRQKIFDLSKTDLKFDKFVLEIGWLVSFEPGKGFGRAVTEVTISHIEKIGLPYFLTIRDDNEICISLMVSLGFYEVGEGYPSMKDGVLVSLYVRD